MGKRHLHIKVRSLFISTFPCAFLGNVRFYGLQDPFLDLNKNAYARKRGGLQRPKRVSCNPQNFTSPRKAHGTVLIRNDFPLMCRGIFPLLLCGFFGGEGGGGEQNREGVQTPKQTISTQLERNRYRWYQSHAVEKTNSIVSVSPFSLNINFSMEGDYLE